jgi:hypothetical protein
VEDDAATENTPDHHSTWLLITGAPHDTSAENFKPFSYMQEWEKPPYLEEAGTAGGAGAGFAVEGVTGGGMTGLDGGVDAGAVVAGTEVTGGGAVAGLAVVTGWERSCCTGEPFCSMVSKCE